jgi:oligoribonuclease (3'-5' exoribonuclease)
MNLKNPMVWIDLEMTGLDLKKGILFLTQIEL